MGRYPRLSLADRANLRNERIETPAHVAALCVLDPGGLTGEDGELDLAVVRRRVERRLHRAPALRRVLWRPPPLCGPPVWVDDPGFSIARHVHSARVDPPGDEARLLESVELLLRPLLDRSRPLWELWLLTGLQDGRLAALFKIHHAIADGLAALALLSALLDPEPDVAEPSAPAWRPAPAPAAVALLADATRGRSRAVAGAVAHPVRVARRCAVVLGDAAEVLRASTAAPPASLTALPGRSRRLRAVHLDLERARRAGHAHGATINDVLLAVVAGGLGAVLAARGELTPGTMVRASVPASLRGQADAGRLGNAVGAILVPLPVGEPDAARRLETIAAATAAAKAAQRPEAVQDLVAWLAAVGAARPFFRRQRLVDAFVTNIPGPAAELWFLGARVRAVLPVVMPAANVPVVLAALSYHGRLDVVVDADAAACPDVDVLRAGMVRAWESLTAATAG